MALNMESVFDTYWRVEQIARCLGCSKGHVCYLIRKGEFPSAREAANDGFRGRAGWEVKSRDVHDFMRRREEKKETRKTEQKKPKSKNIDTEMIELLKELHATMVKQTEIIGKLIEKMT